MQDWIAEELRTVSLPDARLEHRCRLLLDRLSSKSMQSIPTACGGWAETQAAYRFFANERVTAKQLHQPHWDATLERIGQHPVVLMTQDTTQFEMTRQEERLGGPLSDEEHRGYLDHVTLALTPERLTLGVVANQLWARDAATFRQRSKRRTKPIQEKESYRWIESYQQACAVAEQVPQTQVISISDSEGDIYEYFAAAAERPGIQAEFIIRGCQDRCVAGIPEDEKALKPAAKLRETVAAALVLGMLEIQVSKREAQSHDGSKRQRERTARQATVSVQSTTVVLQPPVRPKDQGKLPAVKVNVVLVRELRPPEGEPAIEWVLLTSLAVESFDQACLVIDYYTCRWECEVFFRVLKSGCTIEELQFESTERFEKCLMLYLVVAWRVLYVMRLGRDCPDLPCDVVFTPDEWQAVYAVVKKKRATEKPKLGEMVRMVAQLGGYLNRKNDSPPGPKALWIGLQRTKDLALSWMMAHAKPNCLVSCV